MTRYKAIPDLWQVQYTPNGWVETTRFLVAWKDRDAFAEANSAPYIIFGAFDPDSPGYWQYKELAEELEKPLALVTCVRGAGQ